MASQFWFGTLMSKSMRNMGTEAGFSHLVGAEVPFRTPGSVAWMIGFPPSPTPTPAQRRQQFRAMDLFDND
jgi:hypothetical protein